MRRSHLLQRRCWLVFFHQKNTKQTKGLITKSSEICLASSLLISLQCNPCKHRRCSNEISVKCGGSNHHNPFQGRLASWIMLAYYLLSSFPFILGKPWLTPELVLLAVNFCSSHYIDRKMERSLNDGGWWSSIDGKTSNFREN